MAVQLEWGFKRTCQSCNERFYDMRHNPITCPSCNTPYQIFTSRKKKTDDKDAVKDFDELDIPDEISDVDAGIIEDTDDLDEATFDVIVDELETHTDE
jgi:uncharacterized protein (TIGR02300 family)